MSRKKDWCTASPDLDFGTTCCRQHDEDYAEGKIARAEADRKLRRCISAKGYIVLPWIYWLAVRLFGNSHYKERVLQALPKVKA